jgi:hypothetical protein
MPVNDLISLSQAHSALDKRGGFRRPWDYPVAVALPHYDTPETLAILLDLLRLQTVRPYVLLIDTGSPVETIRKLERFRAPDCEVHYLRARAYRHPSASVTTALDVAMALCRCDYLFLTHTDVFPRRRDLLEWLLALCHAEQPVVGYEMSPRPGTNRWRNVVSHTCTMLHMPSLRRVGVSWSFERYWESGEAEPQGEGYPDTEQPFDRCIRQAGIFPYIIGHDTNRERLTDANIDHARSWTGLKRHFRGTPEAARGYAQLHWALQAAQERVQRWRKEVADGR